MYVLGISLYYQTFVARYCVHNIDHISPYIHTASESC